MLPAPSAKARTLISLCFLGSVDYETAVAVVLVSLLEEEIFKLKSKLIEKKSWNGNYNAVFS